MRKRRRLADLYVRGKEVTFNDGQGDAVKVWIQKLNAIDREACLRRGSAAKARYMTEGDTEDSDLFQSAYAQARDMGADREGLIAIVIAEDLTKQRQKIEAQLTMDEKTWGKDNYIQGLIDAWVGDDVNPGLAQTRAEDPDDPEATRVIDEIERFETEVNKKLKAYAGQVYKDWTDVTDDTLWHKAAHRLIELQGGDVLNREFERQQVFYCVRDPGDHRKRYFAQVSEVDDLSEDLLKAIVTHYNSMLVDLSEGKDSRLNRSSSTSSGQPSEVETAEDSGLQAATA